MKRAPSLGVAEKSGSALSDLPSEAERSSPALDTVTLSPSEEPEASLTPQSATPGPQGSGAT